MSHRYDILSFQWNILSIPHLKYLNMKIVGIVNKPSGKRILETYTKKCLQYLNPHTYNDLSGH